MKTEVEEAIEAIRLHAMWMAGRSDEMTWDDKTKEIKLWGGTDGDERGERLLHYLNVITGDIDKVADELKEALIEETSCTSAERFLKRIDMGDGRTALLNLVLRIADDDPWD